MNNQVQTELVIEAGRTEGQNWKDIWHYRELFYFLSWRDILVRYKQTVIGIAWSLIRPLLTLIVFTIIFGKLAKLPSGGVPYPILVFAAMLPWQFFSNSLSLQIQTCFPRYISPESLCPQAQ
jgi:lipopolysaccharide transport system permease protein